MSADRVAALLEPIQNRLAPVQEQGMQPWRRVVNTAGDSYGVVDSSGSVVVFGTSGYAVTDLIAAAPTDQARLLAAVHAVEDWCKNLDAMETVDPSSAGHRNVSAKGVAETLRAAVTAALGG